MIIEAAVNMSEMEETILLPNTPNIDETPSESFYLFEAALQIDDAAQVLRDSQFDEVASGYVLNAVNCLNKAVRFLRTAAEKVEAVGG